MTAVTHEAFARLRAQALLMADVVELLLATLSQETRAAAAVARAVRLVRQGFLAADVAGDLVADAMDGFKLIEDQVRLMKAENRSPTNLEWEGLRARIEHAANTIAAHTSFS